MSSMDEGSLKKMTTTAGSFASKGVYSPDKKRDKEGKSKRVQDWKSGSHMFLESCYMFSVSRVLLFRCFKSRVLLFCSIVSQTFVIFSCIKSRVLLSCMSRTYISFRRLVL
ncbi:hypothetical protein YC2023_115203 [Brassica napus]